VEEPVRFEAQQIFLVHFLGMFEWTVQQLDFGDAKRSDHDGHLFLNLSRVNG
jgi:hypothetical protein